VTGFVFRASWPILRPGRAPVGLLGEAAADIVRLAQAEGATLYGPVWLWVDADANRVRGECPAAPGPASRAHGYAKDFPQRAGSGPAAPLRSASKAAGPNQPKTSSAFPAAA
jgi:hypothetical protein